MELKWKKQTEIIIVGTGFAGLSAAIEAYKEGCNTIIIEKSSHPGGNSVIASGGINAVDRERQTKQGIIDSEELHFRQTYEGGDKLGDTDKIKYLVNHSLNDCIKWLEHFGVEFSDKIVWGFGTLWPRTHIPMFKNYKRGSAIVHALLNHLQNKNRIEFLYNHKMLKIIRDNNQGVVQGIEVETNKGKYLIRAKKAVILATGGFAANNEWVSKHDRRLRSLDTTNHKGATGEAIRLAQDIGADTLHMDYIQAIPKIIKPPYKAKGFLIYGQDINKFGYYPTMTYKLFINKEGKRFLGQDARRVDILYKLLEQKDFEPLPLVEGNSIENIEQRLGIKRGALIETINTYNDYCYIRHDKDFSMNPQTLVPIKTPPIKAESIAPAVHFTMGGLRTTADSGSVIDREGKIIPRLYAAGEVTGGLHGANRLGHNATPECVLFGRLCGFRAANEP